MFFVCFFRSTLHLSLSYSWGYGHTLTGRSVQTIAGPPWPLASCWVWPMGSTGKRLGWGVFISQLPPGCGGCRGLAVSFHSRPQEVLSTHIWVMAAFQAWGWSKLPSFQPWGAASLFVVSLINCFHPCQQSLLKTALSLGLNLLSVSCWDPECCYP